MHAAYKRALLKFHPDRASKTDIRQQVEAEEKFKLISRMKEKLLGTSCYSETRMLLSANRRILYNFVYKFTNFSGID